MHIYYNIICHSQMTNPYQLNVPNGHCINFSNLRIRLDATVLSSCGWLLPKVQWILWCCLWKCKISFGAPVSCWWCFRNASAHSLENVSKKNISAAYPVTIVVSRRSTCTWLELLVELDAFSWNTIFPWKNNWQRMAIQVWVFGRCFCQKKWSELVTSRTTDCIIGQW